MNIYAHRSFPLNVRAFLQAFHDRLEGLPAVAPHDALIDLLVDLGEAHAAVADAAMPDRDDDSASLAPWSDALAALASAVCASWHHEPASPAIARARRSVAILRDAPTTSDIVSAKTAEGFAYFALYPEQYIAAAERFVHERAPGSLLCVGIRSIGSPLAALVSASARRAGVHTTTITLRPRGHPFDRRIEWTDALKRQARADYAAIVDEGPGLSGTSFAAVSDALASIGFAEHRVVLFPSWTAPSGAFRSARGENAWQRHTKFLVAFEDMWPPAGDEDISAGRWRPHVFGSDDSRWPAVYPQHERRKYLSGAESGQRADGGAHRAEGGGLLVRRFAGLGRYGRAKFERARQLADAGFVPMPVSLERGFLIERWIDDHGTPTVERIAEYVAYLRAHFATGARARVDDLAVDGFAVPDFDEPEIAVDGRMLPHEWRGAIKTDALDHHADDLLPGCRDIAWDVAGAIVEFDFREEAAARLVERYRALSGDRTIGQRLPFYRAAYAAYRDAYATFAAETLGDSADARRFRESATRYRRSLAAPASIRRRSR